MIRKQFVVQGIITSYLISRVFRPECHVLVFLHGWQQNAESFRPLYDRLESEDFSIIGIDLPGFGNTPRPKSTWGVEEYALFIKDFLAKLNVANPVLVGHSFGGRIAVKFALLFPSSVRQLVLMGTAGIRPIISPSRRLILRIGKKFFSLPGFQSFGNYIAERLRSRDYNSAGEMRDIFLKIIAEDLKPFFSQIQADTLLIWGEQDEETPLIDGMYMHDQIQRSTIHTFSKGTHFVFLEYPDEITKYICDFMATNK